CVWDITPYLLPPKPESASPETAPAAAAPPTIAANKPTTPFASWRLGELHLMPAAKVPPAESADDQAVPVVVAKLEHGAQAIVRAAFLPDDSKVLTAMKDGTLSLWNSASGERTQKFASAAPREIGALDVSPDGKMAIGAVGSEAIVWSLDDGRPVVTLKGHAGDVTCVAFGRDPRVVTTGGCDGTLRLWEVPSGASLDPTPAKAHTAAWTAVAFSPDMKCRIAGAADGAVVIERMPGRETRMFEPASLSKGPIQAVSISPDVNVAAAALADGAVSCFPIGMGALEGDRPSPILHLTQRFLSSPPSSQKVLGWVHGGKFAAIYSGGARLDYWYMQNSERAGRHAAPPDNATCLAISADGQTALAGHADGTVLLWKLPGPQLPLSALHVKPVARWRQMLDQQKYDQLHQEH